MATLTQKGIRFATGDQIDDRQWMFQNSTTSPTNFTVWTFYQSAAPTGWTKLTTHDNKALRVVSGTGGGSGGTNSFTSTMSSFVIGGPITSSNATGNYALASADIPGHTHAGAGVILTINPQTFNPDGVFTGYSGGDVAAGSGFTRSGTSGNITGSSGSDGNHNHPFSASGTVPNQTVSIAVQYIDIILCSFDG